MMANVYSGADGKVKYVDGFGQNPREPPLLRVGLGFPSFISRLVHRFLASDKVTTELGPSFLPCHVLRRPEMNTQNLEIFSVTTGD